MISDFAALLGPLGLMLGIFVLLVFVFEIVMFMNVIWNKNITPNARVLWCVGMIFIHPFVAIVYYFTDYKKTR